MSSFSNRVKLLAFGWLILVGSAQADPMISSDTLLGWLKNPDERNGALAVGYIGGVREATYQKEHCASNEVKVPEVVGAVRRTLEGLPQYRNLPASWSVIAALQARWPCPDGKANAAAKQGPPRTETEEFIVTGVRGCGMGIKTVSLDGPTLQIADGVFIKTFDLSKLEVQADADPIQFLCSSPGCISWVVALPGRERDSPSLRNADTVNCTAPMRDQIGRALKHYQGFIGKKKPLF